MVIATKKEMYELFHRGRFGNAGINFSSLEEAEQFPGLIAIRTLNGRGGGGPCEYDILGAYIRRKVQEFAQRGFPWERIQLSGCMPDKDRLRMQGEAMRSPNYIDLSYNLTAGLRMRDAASRWGHYGGGVGNKGIATGIVALELLKWAMGPSDYDDFQSLWDDFPDAVIEFSSYDCHIGNCPRRNTVIWEVRNY